MKQRVKTKIPLEGTVERYGHHTENRDGEIYIDCIRQLEQGDIWHKCAGVTIIYNPDEDPYKDNPEIKKHYKGETNDRNSDNRNSNGKQSEGDE